MASRLRTSADADITQWRHGLFSSLFAAPVVLSSFNDFWILYLSWVFDLPLCLKRAILSNWCHTVGMSSTGCEEVQGWWVAACCLENGETVTVWWLFCWQIAHPTDTILFYCDGPLSRPVSFPLDHRAAIAHPWNCWRHKDRRAAISAKDEKDDRGQI